MSYYKLNSISLKGCLFIYEKTIKIIFLKKKCNNDLTEFSTLLCWPKMRKGMPQMGNGSEMKTKQYDFFSIIMG